VEKLERLIEGEFGEFKYEMEVYIAKAYRADRPEIWQKWWTNRMVGNDDDDEPWSYPRYGPIRSFMIGRSG
jgi:hypothetical protein